MVYKDYWALTQWYEHHGKMLGHHNLYIVAHGADPKIAKICPEASIITIPRDDLSNFDGKRAELLNSIRRGLHLFFDWMIQCDADELICYDAEKFDSMSDFLEKHRKKPTLAALGLNLIEVKDDKPLGHEPVLKLRRNVSVSGHYSKVCVTKEPIRFRRHGVSLKRGQVDKNPFTLAKGLYLIHLKHANTKALMRTDKVRQSVATGKGKRLPGDAWRNPAELNDKVFTRFNELELADWATHEAEVYEQLKEPSLRPGRVMRVRPLHFKKRTMLPEWFQNL